MNNQSAWTRIDIFGEDGNVTVYHSTNDNLDLGYPSEYASWETYPKTIEQALKVSGKSRQGIGCKVDVYLNGEKI